ncbi:MAG TPA: AarF/UbiB family protein [Thermoanaerobaculia bacterium]|nr:AarF/UbiB family protein [Thermoanaerobaculia bacterium]
MIQPHPGPLSPAERKARRRDVERCFAEHALLRRPHSLGRGPEAGEDFGLRLRAALAELGPVFTAFGRYLATRPDLLPAGDCLELAELSDRVEPLPIGAVRSLLADELGVPRAEEVFAEIDEPCASRLLVQAHAARLHNGEAVIVRLVRPALEGSPAADLELLDLLAELPLAGGAADRRLAEAVEDFREDLAARLDLAVEADHLELFATDTADLGFLQVPRVWRNLSTPRVLTVERLGGATLREIAALDRRSAGGADSPDLRDLARRLCILWLRQALLGRAFPVEPRAEDLLILPRGRIVLAGGPFTKPPSAVQANLWSYLVAAAKQDPDEACTSLLREMIAGPGANEEQLRLRLRQVVPFRDGSWSLGGDSLAEHLFVHWRLARESGYRPRAALLAFWRGLFSITSASRQLAPERDALHEALQEVRLIASFGQVREMMTARQLQDNLERYALLATQLPQKLDEILSLGTTGVPAPARPAVEPGRAERRDPWSLVLTFVLALAAVTLVARQLTAAGASWAQPVGAVTALVLGLLLLRGLGGRG